MTLFSLRKILLQKNIDHVFVSETVEGFIPQELERRGLMNIIIIPDLRIIFDPLKTLSYNDINDLYLLSYTVEQPNSVSEFKTLIERYGISY